MAQSQTRHCPSPLTAASTVVILANPYSGARDNRPIVQRLAAALQSRGLEPLIASDTLTLHQVAAHPDFARTCRCIVAAGGDGTVSRVIHTTTAVPLVTLPLGTENLFAACFDHTPDIQRLADRIAAAQCLTIDLGRIGSQRFSVVASAGFDGDVAHRLARWRERGQSLRRVRRHSYLRPIAAAALRYRYPPMEIVADGRSVRGSLALIFNLPRYGFGFRIAPHADPADGLLDWVVFQRPGRLNLARYALALLRRRHLLLPDVICGRAASIEIRCEEPVPVEIDGEAAGFAPAALSVDPAALRVIVD